MQPNRNDCERLSALEERLLEVYQKPLIDRIIDRLNRRCIQSERLPISQNTICPNCSTTNSNTVAPVLEMKCNVILLICECKNCGILYRIDTPLGSETKGRLIAQFRRMETDELWLEMITERLIAWMYGMNAAVDGMQQGFERFADPRRLANDYRSKLFDLILAEFEKHRDRVGEIDPFHHEMH